MSAATTQVAEADEEEAREHAITWDALAATSSRNAGALPGWNRRQAWWAYWRERLALALEKPVNRLIGNSRLNPFYHIGHGRVAPPMRLPLPWTSRRSPGFWQRCGADACAR